MERHRITSAYDGLDIGFAVARPKTAPKAVLQLVHGMCGCKERFEPVMEYMAANGAVCVVAHEEALKACDAGSGVGGAEVIDIVFAGKFQANGISVNGNGVAFKVHTVHGIGGFRTGKPTAGAAVAAQVGVVEVVIDHFRFAPGAVMAVVKESIGLFGSVGIAVHPEVDPLVPPLCQIADDGIVGIQHQFCVGDQGDSIGDDVVNMEINVDWDGVPIVCTFTSETTGGIENIESNDVEAPVEYYNLQGVKVANPENGIFIRVQGGNATKVVL